MFGFLSSKPQNSGQSFGIKVTGNSGVPADLEQMKGNIVRTNKKYREELSKYREIAKFNQQLSNGYIKNLEAMVDVSRVMSYYIEIFNLLREEFEKNEKLMGSSLSAVDIGYIERLTKSKIDELNNKFISESEKLKKIYTTFGRTQEVTRVNEAQQNLKLTTDGADNTFNNLKAIEQGAVQGGARRPRAKKQTAPKLKPKPKSSSKTRK